LRKKGGQFLIIASLFLSLVLFSLALIMSNVAHTYISLPKTLGYNVIRNLEDDLPRALENALALASQVKLSGGKPEESLGCFLEYMEAWRNACFEALGGGVSIELASLQEGCDPIYFSWNRTSSFSYASLLLKVNLTGMGLEGFQTVAKVMVNLTLDRSSFVTSSSNHKTNFSFTLSDGYGEPIAFALSKPGADFKVWHWNTTKSTWVISSINSTSYAGSGRYDVCLNDYVTPYIELLVYFRDERGIVVMASASSASP